MEKSSIVCMHPTAADEPACWYANPDETLYMGNLIICIRSSTTCCILPDDLAVLIAEFVHSKFYYKLCTDNITTKNLHIPMDCMEIDWDLQRRLPVGSELDSQRRILCPSFEKSQTIHIDAFGRWINMYFDCTRCNVNVKQASRTEFTPENAKLYLVRTFDNLGRNAWMTVY